jgi:hypothetical protein
VKVEEVFLPYVANERGQTLFEVMEETSERSSTYPRTHKKGSTLTFTKQALRDL